MTEPFDIDLAVRELLQTVGGKRLVARPALEEMESHLRDEIEDLLASGDEPRAAFERAAAAFGAGGDVQAEFGKLYQGRRLAQLGNLATYYFNGRIVMRLAMGLLLGAFFMLGGLLIEGGNLRSVVGASGFLITAGGALGALVIAYPARVVLRSLVLAVSGREATQHAYFDATRVFRSYGDMALLAGFVGSLFGTVHVLQHLDHPDRIGAGVAVSILSVLYGLLLKLFVGKALADSFEARARPSCD